MPSPFHFYRQQFAVYCGLLWCGTDNPKMTQARALARRLVPRNTFLCIFLIAAFFPLTAQAQDDEAFDPISVGAELDQLAGQLEDEDVDGMPHDIRWIRSYVLGQIGCSGVFLNSLLAARLVDAHGAQ